MSQRTLKLDSVKCLLALLTAVFCGRQAAAISPNLTLQQLDHSSWTIQSGAPSGINALAQTSDGYIWLGTTTGLYRFDGVTFALYQPPHGQRLTSTAIQSLYATRDGGLWIGYLLGESSLIEKGNVHNYFYRADKMPRGTVISFLEDQDGSIWAAAAGGLGRFSGGKWHRLGAEENFDSAEASFLFRDHQGTMWVSTTNNVYYLLSGAKTFAKSGLKTLEHAQFAQTADGTVWVEDPLGLVPLARQMPKTVAANARRLNLKNPDGLLVDRDGTVWESPDDGGVYRMSFPTSVTEQHPHTGVSSWQRFTRKEGLSSDAVTASLEDREGNIWFATSRGLDRFRATTFTPAPIPTSLRSFALAAAPNGAMMLGSENGGLAQLDGSALQRVHVVPQGTVTALYSAPDGKTWIGGQGRLGYLQGGRYSPLAPPPPGPADLTHWPTATQAITMGGDGDVWVSLNGWPVARVHQGVWKPDYTLARKLGTAVTLATDHAGLVWAGYMKNVISIHEGDQVRFLDEKQGLTVGNVTALHEVDARMWVGGEHGLNLYKSGSFDNVTFENRSSVEGITGIVSANDGSLWLNASLGIFRISAEEITAFLKDSSHPVKFEAFNYLDGIPGDAGILYPLPTAIKGSDGRLWFATTSGLVFIDPAHILRNTVVPPVVIRRVLADDRSIGTDGDVRLPRGTRSIEIDYTALSFSIPDRVRFRYKLEGFDKDWQDAGNRRQAFYTSIPPRHYVFRVIACNNDGLWNTTGSGVPIDLPATFLQGWYFEILCFTLGAAVLWWFYRLRISQVEVAIRARLYERLTERERIARDLHDTFFQGIQGLLLSFNLGTSRLAKSDPVRALFEETLKLSDQVMLEGRKLVLDLRTRTSEADEIENDFGSVASEFAKVYPAQFALTVTGNPRRLDAVVSEEIYKIGREALYNAFRHASATNIEVELTYASSEMRLNFRDNGRGIPEHVLQNGSSDGHFGLPGMAERAEKIGARFSMFSRVAGGTEIEIKISSRLAYRSSSIRKRRSSRP